MKGNQEKTDSQGQIDRDARKRKAITWSFSTSCLSSPCQASTSICVAMLTWKNRSLPKIYFNVKKALKSWKQNSYWKFEPCDENQFIYKSVVYVLCKPWK